MISWHSISNPYYWAINLVSVHIGNTPEETAYIPISTNVAVIDTSSSNLVLPNTDFEEILLFLKKDMLCDVNSKGFY